MNKLDGQNLAFIQLRKNYFLFSGPAIATGNLFHTFPTSFAKRNRKRLHLIRSHTRHTFAEKMHFSARHLPISCENVESHVHSDFEVVFF